jgi:hypothetical protein
VNFILGEAKLELRTFALSYPIAATEAQSAVFKDANKGSHNHCTAILSACQFGINTQSVVEVLFIDLTPGQVTAMVMQGVIDQGKWSCEKEGAKVVLGNVDQMSAQKLDELVTLVAPNLSTVQCVAILRPEGAFPELLSIKVELNFVNIPVRWVYLADLSYGSAMRLHHQLGPKRWSVISCGGPYTPQPSWYVQLAGGNFVEVVPAIKYKSGQILHFFTTSKNNQVTATVRLAIRGFIYDGLVIEGLTPNSKGHT